MSKKCISLIDNYLNKDTIMLEIGSGGSTSFFSSKVKKLYSLESEKKWYDKVSLYLKTKNINNVDYRLIPSNLQDKNIGGRYWTYNMYKDYIDQINKYDIKFDIIFIDGMARAHCYLKSFNQLKENGYVIIHDFYNNSNVEKEWMTDILFKYYTEVDSIKETFNRHRNVERGNDVIILKKNNTEYDEMDLLKLDQIIPRY